MNAPAPDPATDPVPEVQRQPAVVDRSEPPLDLRATLPAAVRQYGEFGAELNALVSGEEYDLRRLLSALRETAENLENLTERARQDPPHLFFSSPPRKLAPGEIER